MPALAITAITPGSEQTRTKRIQAAEALSLADVVKKAATGSKYEQSQADAGTGDSTAEGVTLGGTTLDGWAEMVTSGPVVVDETLVVGELYCLSAAAAGKIVPESDLVSTDYVRVIGKAIGVNTLDIDIDSSVAQVP